MVSLTKTAKLRLGILPTLSRARSAPSHSRTTDIRTNRARSAFIVRPPQQSAIEGQTTRSRSALRGATRSRSAARGATAALAERSNDVVKFTYTKGDRSDAITWRTRDQSSCEQPRDFSSYAQTTDKWSNPETEAKPIQINTNPEEKHPRGAENTEPDTPTARPKMIVTVNCTPECSRVKDRPTVRKQSTQQERRHDRMGFQSLPQVDLKPNDSKSNAADLKQATRDTANKRDLLNKNNADVKRLHRKLASHTMVHHILSSNYTSLAPAHLHTSVTSAGANTHCYSLEMGRFRSRALGAKTSWVGHVGTTRKRADAKETTPRDMNWSDRRRRGCEDRTGVACSPADIQMGLFPQHKAKGRAGPEPAKCRSLKTEERPTIIKSHVSRMAHNAALHSLENELNADCGVANISVNNRLKDARLKVDQDKLKCSKYVIAYDGVVGAEDSKPTGTFSLGKVDSSTESSAAGQNNGGIQTTAKAHASVITLKWETIPAQKISEENDITDCYHEFAEFEQSSALMSESGMTTDDTGQQGTDIVSVPQIRPVSSKHTNLSKSTDAAGYSRNVDTSVSMKADVVETGDLGLLEERAVQTAEDGYLSQDNAHLDADEFSPRENIPNDLPCKSRVTDSGRQSRIDFQMMDSERICISTDSDFSDSTSLSDSSTEHTGKSRNKMAAGGHTLARKRPLSSNGIRSKSNRRNMKSDKSVRTVMKASVDADTDGYASDVSSDVDSVNSSDLEDGLDWSFSTKQESNTTQNSAMINDKETQCSIQDTSPQETHANSEESDRTNLQKYGYDYGDSSSDAPRTNKDEDNTDMLEYSQVCSSIKKTLRYVKSPDRPGLLIPVADYLFHKYNRHIPAGKLPNKPSFAIKLKDACRVKLPETDPTGRELLQTKRRYGFAIEPTDFVRRISCENARYAAGKVHRRPYYHLE